MNWLIWKEFRLQRLVLALGLFLLVVPYAFPAYMFMADSWFTGGWDSVERRDWSGAAVFSMVCSVLTLALLGGNAIASERLDRSAEFQGYQPISRRRLAYSKLLFPLSTALVVWGTNLLVLALARMWNPDSLSGFGVIVIAGFCACGVAWLVSSLQDSPTFATVSGVVAPIVIFSFIPLLVWQTGIRGGIILVSLTTIALLGGLASFAAGTWLYLRRVEP